MKGFGELLFEAIDDAMRQIFGESASELIYRFMKRHVVWKREEAGEKIEVFYSYLEKLLGSEGVQIIRETSLKRLCLKLRREYEEIETYFSFLDKIYEIKFKLLVPSASSLTGSSFSGRFTREKTSVCN